MEKSVGIKDVKTWLGDDADLFKYSIEGDREGDYIILRFKEYVGKQTFSRAAKIIREHGGEYISDGKNSHFRFLITLSEQLSSTKELSVRLMQAKDLIQGVIDELEVNEK